MWNVVQKTYARDERGRMRLKGVAEYQFTDQKKQECINAITFSGG